ncbi:hypothetical protein ACVITL_000842 [Rhizobium pisi]
MVLRPASRRLKHARPRLEMIAKHIGLYGDNDDEPNRDHLKEHVDPEKVKGVADDADQHGADQGVAEMASSAKEASATDNHRSNRVELQKIAVDRRGGGGPSRK